MHICLIGNNLTSIVLAKNLINKKIKVSIFCEKTNRLNLPSKTIGISKKNFDFFERNIMKLKKNKIWHIKKIEIFNEKSQIEKILNFENNKKQLFTIVKDDIIYKSINDNLKKNSFLKKVNLNKNSFFKDIVKKKYNLIINCDSNNFIAKNFFTKKIEKNYNSSAYTCIIRHKKIINRTASQIFTKVGPLAFLPLSNLETSIVFSIRNNEEEITEKKFKELINRYNKIYKIEKFSKINKFKLNSLNLRNYYHKNIMAFGESLHKIHPLAGQGFNMTLRDIEILSKIIDEKIDLGLQLNESVYSDFEKKTRHFNLLFSTGIDFIYEFFHIDSKKHSNYSSKLLKKFDKNSLFKKIITKYADNGINF